MSKLETDPTLFANESRQLLNPVSALPSPLYDYRNETKQDQHILFFKNNHTTLTNPIPSPPKQV